MKIIHGEQFSDDEKAYFKTTLSVNIILGLKDLAEIAREDSAKEVEDVRCICRERTVPQLLFLDKRSRELRSCFGLYENLRSSRRLNFHRRTDNCLASCVCSILIFWIKLTPITLNGRRRPLAWFVGFLAVFFFRVRAYFR